MWLSCIVHRFHGQDWAARLELFWRGVLALAQAPYIPLVVQTKTFLLISKSQLRASNATIFREFIELLNEVMSTWNPESIASAEFGISCQHQCLLVLEIFGTRGATPSLDVTSSG